MSNTDSPSKLELQGNSILKGSISGSKEPQLVKQDTNVSKFSRCSEIEYGGKNEEIKEEDQGVLEKDEHNRYASYSFDFEQD